MDYERKLALLSDAQLDALESEPKERFPQKLWVALRHERAMRRLTPAVRKAIKRRQIEHPAVVDTSSWWAVSSLARSGASPDKIYASIEKVIATDSLFTPFSQPGYPLDVQVSFPGLLATEDFEVNRHELMWVRVLAPSSEPNHWIGRLLNIPQLPGLVEEGHYVEFRALANGLEFTRPAPIAFREQSGSMPTQSNPMPQMRLIWEFVIMSADEFSVRARNACGEEGVALPPGPSHFECRCIFLYDVLQAMNMARQEATAIDDFYAYARTSMKEGLYPDFLENTNLAEMTDRRLSEYRELHKASTDWGDFNIKRLRALLQHMYAGVRVPDSVQAEHALHGIDVFADHHIMTNVIVLHTKVAPRIMRALVHAFEAGHDIRQVPMDKVNTLLEEGIKEARNRGEER